MKGSSCTGTGGRNESCARTSRSTPLSPFSASKMASRPLSAKKRSVGRIPTARLNTTAGSPARRRMALTSLRLPGTPPRRSSYQAKAQSALGLSSMRLWLGATSRFSTVYPPAWAGRMMLTSAESWLSTTAPWSSGSALSNVGREPASTKDTSSPDAASTTTTASRPADGMNRRVSPASGARRSKSCSFCGGGGGGGGGGPASAGGMATSLPPGPASNPPGEPASAVGPDPLSGWLGDDQPDASQALAPLASSSAQPGVVIAKASSAPAATHLNIVRFCFMVIAS